MVVTRASTESRRHSSLLFKDTVLQIMQGLLHWEKKGNLRLSSKELYCDWRHKLSFLDKQTHNLDTSISIPVNELLMSMNLSIHEHLKRHKTL